MKYDVTMIGCVPGAPTVWLNRVYPAFRKIFLIRYCITALINSLLVAVVRSGSMVCPFDFEYPALMVSRRIGVAPALKPHPFESYEDRKSTRLNSSHRCISYA